MDLFELCRRSCCREIAVLQLLPKSRWHASSDMSGGLCSPLKMLNMVADFKHQVSEEVVCNWSAILREQRKHVLFPFLLSNSVKLVAIFSWYTSTTCFSFSVMFYMYSSIFINEFNRYSEKWLCSDGLDSPTPSLNKTTPFWHRFDYKITKISL